MGVGCSSPPATPASETSAPAAARDPKPNEVDLDQALAERVNTATVQTTQAPEAVDATGRIIPAEDRTWRLGAVVEGRFEKTLVEAGDRVKKGQLLAGMHSHDIHDSRA